MMAKLSQFYLVSGLFDHKGDKPFPIKTKSVRLIVNTLVAIKDEESKQIKSFGLDAQGQANQAEVNPESLQVYMVDAYGRICNFDKGAQKDSGDIPAEPMSASADIKTLSTQSKLYFPAKRAALYSLLTQGYDDWVQSLRKLLAGIESQGTGDFSPSISLQEQLENPISLSVKDYFITPSGVAKTEDEQAYANWYADNKDQELPVIVMPRIRGVVISFSSDIYRGATITIRDRSGKLCFQGSDSVDVVDNIPKKHIATVQDVDDMGYAAVFYDTEDLIGKAEKIQDQVFRIEVAVEEKEGNPLSGQVYSFAERFRFQVRNLAGDFEVINGDALSLEESMIQQFPTLHSKQQLLDNKQSQFDSYAHYAKTSHGVAATASGLIGASMGQKSTRRIGRLLANNLAAINTPVLNGVSVKDIMSVAFSIYDLKDGYADYIKEKAAAMSKLLDADSTKVLSAAKAYSELDDELQGVLNNAANIAGQPIDTYLSKKVGDVTQVVLPKSVYSWLQSKNKYINDTGLMDKLDVAGAAIGFASNAHGAYSADMDRAKAKGNLHKSAMAYANLINMVPVNFEDAESVKLDQERREAIKATAQELKQYYKDDLSRSVGGEKIFIKVNFKFDKASFDAKTYEDKVKKFVSIVNASDHAQDVVVNLVGHTCDIGTPKYNQDLSERRAITVLDVMKQAGAKFELRASGRGEDDPGGYTVREQRRRVEAVITINQARRYYPSREGMVELERYRSMMLLYSRSAKKQTLAAIKSAIDGILCIPHPKVMALKLIWEAGGLFLDIVDLFDKLIYGNDFLELIKKHDDLVVESRDNLISRLEDLPGGDARASYLQSQHQLRAESLYGLMRLLVRCTIEEGMGFLDSLRFEFKDANGREEYSFEENLKYYRVEEYIQKFVLNDGWQLPTGMCLPVTLDQHWIQIIEDDYFDSIINSDKTTWAEKTNALVEKHTGQDVLDYAALMTNVGQAKMAFEQYKKLKDTIVFSPVQGLDYISVSNSKEFLEHENEVMTAQYQSYFPVHYRAAPSVQEFAAKFKNNYSGIDKDAYSYCAIGVRSFGSTGKGSEGWQQLAKRVNGKKGISPLEQIRISVFLDSDKIKSQIDDGSIRYMPIQVMPIRRDGFNIAGVATKDFIQEINVKSLTDYEKKELLELGFLQQGKSGYEVAEGKYLFGAILTPFYLYGENRLYGTRPMAGSIESWFKSDEVDGAANTYEIDGLWAGLNGTWEMEYAYEVMLAHRPSTLKGVTYKDEDGDDTDEFTVSIDETKTHSLGKGKGEFLESKLLRPHFLQSRVGKEVHPELFKKKESIVLIRNGDGVYVDPFKVLKTDKVAHYPGGDIHIQNFDWKKPVEIIVLVVAEGLNTDEYEELKLPWKSLPVSVKVTDGSLIASSGPEYLSKLSYIGKFSGAGDNAEFIQNDTAVANDSRFSELKKYFKDPKVVDAFSNIKELSETLKGIKEDDDTHEYVKAFSDMLMKVTGGTERHVYAAHINLTYQSLTGELIQGLRPFNVDFKRQLRRSPNANTDYLFSRIGFELVTPGDSGFNGNRAEGVYRVSQPDGFDKQDSHWYQKPKKDKRDAVELLHQQILDDQKQGRKYQSYDPELFFSHWANWVRLSENGEWLTEQRIKVIDNWLEDQKGRAELPKGASLLE